MKIYIAHSRNFDFQTQLYEPLQSSKLASEHTLIFPHSESALPFNSKELFQTGCDLIIAEVSYPATGLGIELGWGNLLNIPIICIYQKDAKLSGSLKIVCDTFIEYSDAENLVFKIRESKYLTT